LNGFGFLLYPKVSKKDIVLIGKKPMHASAYNVRLKLYSTVESIGVPYSSRGFKISKAESIDAAIIHTVE
jgi:hypothetical protein